MIHLNQKENNNNKVEIIQKVKNKINGHNNHQLMNRIISEVFPIQILKYDLVNNNFLYFFTNKS